MGDWMIFLPIRTTDVGNRRLHWRKEAKLNQTERHAARISILATKGLPPFPVKVTLTRIGRRVDSQNLGSHFKSVIDGIADAYGVDDGDRRWQFVFQQEPGKHHGENISMLWLSIN